MKFYDKEKYFILFCIIFINISSHFNMQLCCWFYPKEINTFTLQGAPESFYIHIISPSPFGIHANNYIIHLEHRYPRMAGILASLVAVKNVWFAMLICSQIKAFYTTWCVPKYLLSHAQLHNGWINPASKLHTSYL